MSRAVNRNAWKAGSGRLGFLLNTFLGCFPGSRHHPEQEKGSGPAGTSSVETVRLSEKELCVLELSRAGTIACLEGTVWITFPHRFCDYVLKAGESLSLRGPGRLLASGGCRKCTITISRN